MLRACGLALVMFMSAVVVTAQEPVNGVGVFFDESGSVTCLSSGLDSLVTGHIVLHAPSASFIAGWQGRLTSDSGVYIVDLVFMGEALNAGSGSDLIVGLGTPLPYDDQVLLARFRCWASEPGGIYFGSLSNGQGLAYCDSGAVHMVPMWAMYGGGVEPNAAVCPLVCPEANEVPPLVSQGGLDFGEKPAVENHTTWGKVKVLYDRSR